MKTEMPSSLEIAQNATLSPILDVAAAAGLEPREIEPYGAFKGKIDLSVLERLAGKADAKLVNVTAIGLGGRANGYVRQTGFDITAASEVMAIVAVARDVFDLRARLGAITVGSTYEGEPVTAEQLKAAGAMAVLLKDAIKPNIVQTLEGQPALVHCGPFANIA